jgi:hypothetical protein
VAEKPLELGHAIRYNTEHMYINNRPPLPNLRSGCAPSFLKKTELPKFKLLAKIRGGNFGTLIFTLICEQTADERLPSTFALK